MRNISDYPITAEEVISSLQVSLESYTKNIHKDGVGGIDGLAFLLTEKFIEQNSTEFNKFAKEFCKNK